RIAGKTDVCRPCSLGAHSAHLRALRPKCLGNVPPAQHASAHIAAHSGATLPKVIVSTIARKIWRILDYTGDGVISRRVWKYLRIAKQAAAAARCLSVCPLRIDPAE